MADEEDFSTLPLADRAVHKVWKVRAAAYEEMKKQFMTSGSESDGCFMPFLDNPGVYKKIVMDANVVAQEAGVGSLCAFLEFGGTNACLRTRSTVVPSLVEKALASTRQGTRRNAIDALLWYIELDTPEPVVEEIVPFLGHKLPKLIVASAQALTEILVAFGAKTVSPKPVVKSIPKLFGHADKNVRAEANKMTVELYKWLGDAFAQAILPDLKPVQQKELQEAFDQVKGEAPHQQRYLKSQREAMERQQASGIDDQQGNVAEDEDEEMADFVEAVAVLGKVPPNFADRLGSSKWKDRKEALEQLREVLSVPKMENEDFSEITRLLAKCMKDANIMVVVAAANCIQKLAEGLRSNFAHYQATVLSPMLERTKEKKASVSEALSGALDAVFKSGGMHISDILESVVEYLKHKTPQVRIETAKFLVRSLKATKLCPKPPEVKAIVDVSLKLLNDTQEPVRSGGAEILGVLMKIFGERAMNPHLDSVDDIKKAKINEFCQSAEVHARPEQPKPKPAPKPAGGPAVATGRKVARPASKMPQAQAQPQAASTSSATGIANSTAAPRGLPRMTPAKAAVQAQSTSSVLARKRLASPLKPSAVRSERYGSGEEEQQGPPSPVRSQPPPRSGLQRQGLTARTLPSATAQARAAAAIAPQQDAKIATLEKELEQLRLEKSEWLKEKEKHQWQLQEERGEKARLLQEINDLQLKNAQLVEDHTRDILAIKSKETQLVRAVSDVETARVKISKLENELARAHARLETPMSSEEPSSATSSSSTTTRSPFKRNSVSGVGSPKSSMTIQFGLDSRSHYRTGSNSSSIRRSVDFSTSNNSSAGDRSSFYGGRLASTEEKENSTNSNGYKQHSRHDTMSSVTSSTKDELEYDGDTAMADAPPPAQSSFNSTYAGPGENWKRAVEVTAKLRERIEAMKARQNRT
ncbi:protein Stu2p [Trichomonascus vanleenenianus]|uniref:Stu2p n=1 Tax=Trichomonascus vanleenenianus TaxID=2268995 RepID=UPI003EC9B657